MTEVSDPVDFNQLYISSSDTLGGKLIDQSLDEGWNDRPPLFITRQDDEKLLKGMLRRGVPSILRCAVWTSSVIRASNPHQPREHSDEFRTIGKVRQLDYAWDAVVQQTFSHESDLDESLAPNFGNEKFLEYQLPMKGKGKTELYKILSCLEHVLGLEYAPLIPSIVSVMMRFMSASYTFCALREMGHNSSWYFPVSQIEHRAWCCAFRDVLGRLHPQTAEIMDKNGSLSPESLDPIFKHFFLPIMKPEHVYLIMDIYTLEGFKVLLRFGVALLCLVKRDLTDLSVPTADTWWEKVKAFTHSETFKFQVLVKRAYGYHGHAVRKRLRFPRRHILARIVRIEEERARVDMSFEPVKRAPRPLGFIANEDLELAKSAHFRSSLSGWLPLALRLTKLDLLYSTNVHGRALERFYSAVGKSKHTILLCQVMENNSVIGMFASQNWRVSANSYGDGECFLFRLDPDPQCWKWLPDDLEDFDMDESGDNCSTASFALLEQFMVGRKKFISMGANESGGSGLRFNEDFTSGHSSLAKGFHNEPLPGITDFQVGLVEVYQLISAVDGRTIE